MPTWSGILKELADSQVQGQPPQFDAVRRKYLGLAHNKSGRDVILYASRFLQQSPYPISPNDVNINDEDIQGLMEVCYGLKSKRLDLILHSPGGLADAAEAIVVYLRSRFDEIRVIVPQLAMSAATMIACAADSLLLGKHSFLGPVDPQLVLITPLGPRMVPAQALLEQFEEAKRECVDPSRVGAWLPMLGQYGPDLLVQCRNATDLAETLVRGWLEKYMLKGGLNPASKAAEIAHWLSDHSNFKSHGRHIPRQLLEEKGLKVEYLERDPEAQDILLSVFHATTHTFSATPATKIIENHLGKAFIKFPLAAMVPPQKSPTAP